MDLTVIMPCFNSEETLRQAVESIFEQELMIKYEVVIVDDCSIDGTRDIILALEKEYPKIRHVFHDINLGGGAARNTAVENSKGKYIFCLDSDDILPKSMLPKMIEYLEMNHLDGVVIGKSIFFAEDISDIKFTVEYEDKILNFEDLFTGKPISVTGNFLYTADAFHLAGGYPINHGFDTQGFGFRILANNLKVKVMKDAFYYQRLPKKDSYYIREVNSGNLSKNWFYILLDNLYKFDSGVKDLLMNYSYQDPCFNNSEVNLIKSIKKQDIILNFKSLNVNYSQAEDLLSSSSDKYDQLWMSFRSFNKKEYQKSVDYAKKALESGIPAWVLMQILISPLYVSGHFNYEDNIFSKLDFFSKRNLKRVEKIKILKMRMIRKLKKMIGF